MKYKNTFICVADDCPVQRSEVPTINNDAVPIHVWQYRLLKKYPYKLDHEDLVFEVFLRRNGYPEDISDQEAERARAQVFSKKHACLRASALTKRYGFGVHYDDEGKIALYPMESPEYQSFLKDKQVEKRKAMRQKRLA